MANHASAKTRIVRNQRAAEINASYLNKVRSFVKKLEKAILSGSKDEAKESFRCAESALGKAAQKGIIKPLAAARKTSRLSARVKKM